MNNQGEVLEKSIKTRLKMQGNVHLLQNYISFRGPILIRSI